MTSQPSGGWSTEEWARKLKQQAEDSKEYRHKLYNKVGLKSKSKILDVGCGTGAITLDIALNTDGDVTAIDIDPEKLDKARTLTEDVPNVKIIEADALSLPFEDESFDLVVFNIVLIHVKDQQLAVNEMTRVADKGGIVLATLEPDYNAMISYPETEFEKLWKKEVGELGADLSTGRKLKSLFNRAGLRTTIGFDTETEFLLINDNEKTLKAFTDNYWVTEKILRSNGWTEEQIEKYKTEQEELIKTGQTFRLSTCFYAIGETQ
jgi:ubiquinone/menaquinone biosynthesis C-methylase UbiE